MRVVFCGSGSFGEPTLRWLAGSAHQVVGVVTQPARQAGRGRKVQATPIAMAAEELGLSCFPCADVNSSEGVGYVRSLSPEAIVVIAFGQKIGAALLSVGACHVINLHGSLLPKYRGAAPINWAIIHGETETGVSVITLNERWDAGAVLGQARLCIGPDETAGAVHDRLAALGPAVVGQVLGDLEAGLLQEVRQDEAQVSRAPKLRKSDGAIDWTRPAEAIRNQVRGMWPWPGAYCYLEQQGKTGPERVTMGAAVVAAGAEAEDATGQGVEAGTVLEDFSIVCGSGRLRPVGVKPDGGKLMSYEAFARGRHLQAGDMFLNG